MKKQFKVYLAGPITGLTYGEAEDWRTYVANRIDTRIECYSPLRAKNYLAKHGKLEGAYDEFPLSTAVGITTRDRFDCVGADLVLFNLLGSERVSIGTMIELGWCDAVRSPAVLVMEQTGNVHEHPMVTGTTGFRTTSLDGAIALIEMILLSQRG